MNQESSRSHSVFTCVIESQCVTDSVTSFRYGRLNLVDLAGSERQKASGAEGERLREAANINKSLSTLGLVIMILVDVAQGKQRHVPYRDSKLTFLLQDSLGGNSKTTIIATVSPAIACANETLSTLKFAQRAKFIQNNAVINEDASGDVKVLQSQIQDLKRELEKLKEQRQLSKSSPLMGTKKTEITDAEERAQRNFAGVPPGSESLHKDHNLKEIQGMEEFLAGRLSREQEMLHENNELAAENQQLNSLIQAYERDLNYVKTMLQLKEDKFQRLQRVEDSMMSAEEYLQEENRLLRIELRLLKDRVNNHPELLRFALENKHLIQQLRRHDESYGQEREMLMVELAKLREQALNSEQEDPIQVKQGRQMMSSTQNAPYDNEGNQTSHFESLFHRGELVITENCLGCNNCDNVNVGDLVSLLEEGNQALNEALEEVKTIQGSTFTESENQPTNPYQANTIIMHGRHKVVNCSLQQLYEIAKDAKDCFEVLCNVAVDENERRKSESLKVLLPSWGDKQMDVNTDLTTIIHESEYCKLNQHCGPAEQMIQVSSQQCRLTNLTKERLLSEEDCGSKSGTHSRETLSDGALANANNNSCLRLRSKSQESNSKDFFCQVAECGGVLCERLIKEASHAKRDHKAKQEVCSNFASCIRIALGMMQESLDVEKQRGPIEDWNSELSEWKQAFDDDARQTCMEGLNHEKVLIQLQKQLAEIYHILKDENIRFDALCRLTKKLKAREKQWLSEKMSLKHQLLRLQSDAVAKDREIAALQNEETILAGIVNKLHEGEEGMREELINLKHQLDYSENQRLLAEQLYKQSLEQSKKDHIKARPNLPEADISEQNNIEKMKIDLLERELEKAHQFVDMQKQLMMTEDTGMATMLAVLEDRLQEAEHSWKGGEEMNLLDLEKTKLVVPEKIDEATDALEKFKHGQKIMREAELVVNALTKANEDNKIQKLNLMHQWHEERERMVTKIGKLESLIVQKEEKLRMQEQEVQQMISTRETMVVLAWKENNANVPDGEERKDTSANMVKISNKINCMPSSEQELFTANFQPSDQLYASKCSASVLGNTSVIDSVEIIAKKLDFNNLPSHDINHIGLAQEDFRREKQKQLPALEMPFWDTQVQHKQSQVSAELHDLSKDVVILKTELEKSRYNMLQPQNSNATTKLISQEGESDLEQSTWLQEASCREFETGGALGKLEEENRAQTVLRNTIVEKLLVLKSYDKSASLLLEKLEGIVETISGRPDREDAWVRFLDSFKHALSMLEEHANSCLKFSNVICEKLDKALAEKQSLEQELERKKELLKGSFFDLSLLQENTAEHINIKSEIDRAFSFIQSLQEELDIKNQKLREKEVEYANLEHEKIEDTNRIRFFETSLSEAWKQNTSLAKENADIRKNLEDALSKIELLGASLELKKQTIEKLELELLDVNLLAEQRMVNGVKQELSLTLADKDQLQTRLVTLEEQLDATRLAVEINKRLADEAQQVAETSKSQIQEKETEVKFMEKSIRELEDTINALENQMEILKREMELQQLIKEDLEMDLQALRQQQCHNPSSKKECSEDTEDTKRQQEQTEIVTLRKELTDKCAEIKSLKLQVDELISAAGKQAAAHYQKVASLEAMADSPNFERRLASPKTRKAGDRNVAGCSTSPFKCLSSGFAQQINFEMDEELYSNRCRIDELEDLAASRQKEIFRLNKKLADAEAMTYDVIRDLLGVKSDIATHASSCLDHEELVKFSNMASHHPQTAIHKEKELEALRDRYNKERASWLEDTARRQAEAVAALVAVEKLRHKDFLLKAENKRLKTDLSRQKKRLLHIQDKLKASSGQGKYHHQHRDELPLNHWNAHQLSRAVDFER